MGEPLRDGINEIDDDGNVVPSNVPDKHGYAGNTVVREDDGEDFGPFEKKRPETTAGKRGSFDKKVVHAAGDIIFKETIPHAGIYNRGDHAEVTPLEPALPEVEEPTAVELVIDEEVLEGTSAAGTKRSVRMKRAIEHSGFAPSDYRELTYYALRESIPGVGGSATAFNRIYRRQKKLVDEKQAEYDEAIERGEDVLPPEIDSEMPKRTMFAIVKEYRGFIEKARGDESVLTQLQTALENYFADDSENAGDLPLLANEEWLKESWVHRSVVVLQSMKDAEALAQGETDELPKAETYFVKDPEIRAQLDLLVHSMTVGDLRERLGIAIARKQAEKEYFKQQLIDVQKHANYNNFAAIAAKRALVALRVLPPEAAA